MSSESAAEDFAADLLASLPPVARQAATTVLERWQGATIYINRKAGARSRTAYAATMIRAGLSADQVKQRLAQRFKVSKSTARRIYQAAIAESSKPLGLWISEAPAWPHLNQFEGQK